MLLKFNSSNPYLLDILYKNPNTDLGLYLKPLKNGVIVGNAVDAHHYEVVFQDTKYSFLQDETQLDFQSYCNPSVVLHILSELFLHLLVDKNVYFEKEVSWLSKKHQDIDNQVLTIDVPNIYLDSNWFNERGFLLSKYLPQVRMEHQIGNNYSLHIEGKTVFEAMNLLAITACFIDITNTFKTTWLTEDWYVKYVRILTNVANVPYFVFYLFIKRCIKSPKVFEMVKPTLENYFKNDVVKFVFTDTHQTRKDNIFNVLGCDFPIIDVGCGELQYYKMFAGKGFSKNYYAIDRDENVVFLVEKLQKNGADKLEFFNDIAVCDVSEKVNIIISEVIEHNTLDDTKAILETVKKYNFNKIIITTPNRAFNTHYSMSSAFRRDDHVYEMDSDEFNSLITNTFEGFEIEISQIGDSINGVSPTQMAVIKN